jgi:hypothetical protein
MPVLFDAARTEIAIARLQAARVSVEGLELAADAARICSADPQTWWMDRRCRRGVLFARQRSKPTAGERRLALYAVAVAVVGVLREIDSEVRPCRFSAFLCIKRGLILPDEAATFIAQ